MLKRLGPARPSPAMLVAVVALIVALGGTSVASDAVDLAKKKLITGKNIKKKSIQGDRLKDNTLTGTQVDESKLGKVPSATKADTATSATSATNATNATSATNSTQLGGHAAASFLRGTVTVIASAAVPANSFGGNTAICPTGYQAIGGGVSPQNVLTMQVTESAPFVESSDPFVLGNGQHGAGTGWIGFARDTSGSAQTTKIVAVCAPTG